MSIEDTLGARAAGWWVATITRTAEPQAALDRREEVAADVHDQLVEARRCHTLAAGSRSVLSRVLRGAPADIAWRVGMEARPSRFAWHLRNPSTVITALFVVMVPITLVADSSRVRAPQLIDYRVPLWIATDLLGCSLLTFALLAVAARVWGRGVAGAASYDAPTALERLRRGATATLGVAWAGSAVFRFGAVASVGAAFWGAFGICLLAYLLLILVPLAARVLTLGSYLPKIWA